MKTIEYSEVAYLSSVSENWNEVHKSVYSVATNNQHFHGDRPFIFNVLTNNNLRSEALVTLRGRTLPMVAAEAKSLAFRVGDRVDLALTICAVASQRTGTGKKRDVAIQAPYDHWFTGVGRRYGFHPSCIRVTRNPTRHAQKSENTVIYIPSITIDFSAEITDEDQFESAWLEGVGRKKAYGMGMLELNRRNVRC